MKLISLPANILTKRIERKRMLLQQAKRLLGFTPADPFADGLALCESPIEEMFWEAGYAPLSRLGKFQPQYNVFGGRYRLDFALCVAGTWIAIECDGEKFHGSRKQILADKQRELALKCAGWETLRFWGWEINDDVERCVRDVARLARAIR